jgi:bifunctional non-homologous end joining protein LigD
MKPMLPSLSFEITNDVNWYFEVKYDGFRAILEWGQSLELLSRNEKPLLKIFPEIEEFLIKNKRQLAPYLPLILDGELVSLENPFKADFGSIQIRGRMRSKERILQRAKQQPCRLLIFDLLMFKGKSLKNEPYLKRKKELMDLFKQIGFPLEPSDQDPNLIQLIPAKKYFQDIWENVVLHNGEGIVAKQENSLWEEGKRSVNWIKYKNWKYVSCFITCYEKTNGYFYVGVYKGTDIQQIGLFLFGLTPEEKQALSKIIKENQIREDHQFIFVPPAICVEIKYLEVYEEQLREPHFHQFLFDEKPMNCTYEKFLNQQTNIPLDVEFTHPEKPIWENPPIKKIDYLHYLQEISPFMLPFLQDRVLTVIRFPHGMYGEPFYQKNVPDYAPNFVDTHISDNIKYIICNNLKTLLWLGNQLAIEFHLPFQTIQSHYPSEIVLDLDPPSRDDFHLAIKAALLIKDVLDDLKLISFIKTSGNKGLQIYIPLPEKEVSYDDCRLFTSFIAEYLISVDPDSFTIERMKKNRGNRLYVDYIQHAEGKTIIAPYSMRGVQAATVATPLYWDEVDDQLSPLSFNITNIINRIKTKGDPFHRFFEAKESQNITPIFDFLKNKKRG